MIPVTTTSTSRVIRILAGSLGGAWRACLVCLLLGLTACGAGHHDGLRFAVTNAPVTLDPRQATDAVSSRVVRLLYDRLVDFDDGLRPVPALADWRRIDPLHYRFTLRRTPGFGDGTHLTAADVKATYESILDPALASPHRLSLSHIRAIETDGARRIDFYLSRPDVLFPGRLTIGILPARAIAGGHAFNREPLGTGPFRLLDWPGEGRLRLVRRRDGLVVEFMAVKDPTVRALKLLRGEVDMLQNDLPPEIVGYLDRQEGIVVRHGRGSNFAYLGFNLEDSTARRPELRRAISLAIDRRSIIEHLLGGRARPAAALLPPEHWAGNPDLSPPVFDPARARRLLAMAGLTGDRRPSLVYKTSSDPFRLRLATIVQQQLAEVGIDVRLRSYDWGTFYGDIKAGRFQMYSLMWVGIKLPDIFRYVFHSGSVPPNGANRGRYRNPEADALIEHAETVDIESAAGDYRRLQAMLFDDLPYVPLWYEDNVLVARGNVHDYRLAIDGNYDGLADVRID